MNYTECVISDPIINNISRRAWCLRMRVFIFRFWLSLNSQQRIAIKKLQNWPRHYIYIYIYRFKQSGKKELLAVQYIINPFSQSIWEKLTVGILFSHLVKLIGISLFGNQCDADWIVCSPAIRIRPVIMGVGPVGFMDRITRCISWWRISETFDYHSWLAHPIINTGWINLFNS